MYIKCVFRRMLTVMSAFTFLAVQGAETENDTVFSSNLPLVIIHTSEAINAESKVMGTMRVIYGGPGKRNCLTDTIFDYDGLIGIKWRGNSSLSFEQKKYTIETRSADSSDLKVSLLGMPAESDWVLLAPYNDISLMRDVFAFSLWNEMGHWGPHTRMCEVFVNDEYGGIYILSEKIKRGHERVDIAKLKSDDVSGRDVTGGYILRVDAFDDGDATFPSTVPGIQPAMWGSGSSGTVTWTVYYPSKEDLQPEQMSYISEYIRQVEESFQSVNYTDQATGYAQWIDVQSFVDYFIHTELSLNADGFKRSSYFYKEKDPKGGGHARLVAGPVWDYNLAYGNCNFCNANNTEAWVYQGCYTNPTPAFWSKLVADPSFMDAVEERYAELRCTLLSQDSIYRFIDRQASLLEEAQRRHYKKYANLLSSNNSGNGGWGWGWGVWGGGNNNPVAAFAAYTVASYAEEIEVLKEWFAKRLAFLDRQWHYDATSLSTVRKNPLSVRAYFCRPDQLCVESDCPLTKIELYSLSGHRIGTPLPATVSNANPRATAGPSTRYVQYVQLPTTISSSILLRCQTPTNEWTAPLTVSR